MHAQGDSDLVWMQQERLITSSMKCDQCKDYQQTCITHSLDLHACMHRVTWTWQGTMGCRRCTTWELLCPLKSPSRRNSLPIVFSWCADLASVSMTFPKFVEFGESESESKFGSECLLLTALCVQAVPQQSPNRAGLQGRPPLTAQAYKADPP